MNTEKNEQFEEKKDRIGIYLIPRLDKELLFDELSDNYLAKAGVADILTGVPVPIRMDELSKGISTVMIAKNMAYVIGCDINFRYRDNYIAYIERTFTKDFVKPLLKEGVDLAANGDHETACIYFRAAIQIDPHSTDALYCYGRACKDAYERGEGEDPEYVGRFKADSLEAFEKLTLADPGFAMGFYFLGFGYVNLGLYVKASLTWGHFMELTRDDVENPETHELRDEIRGLMKQLELPCIIENGYNAVLRGSYNEGIEILSPYRKDKRFNQWWPLWYYLGEAYKGLGDAAEAEACFLEALKLSPSNADVMQELVEIYEALGETEKREKYENKIRIVKRNAALDREEKRAAERPGLS